VTDDLKLFGQGGIVFQPDDGHAPASAALAHEVERLRHFLAGISSIIAVRVVPRNRRGKPEQRGFPDDQ